MNQLEFEFTVRDGDSYFLSFLYFGKFTTETRYSNYIICVADTNSDSKIVIYTFQCSYATVL